MSLHAILEAIRSSGEEKALEIESRAYKQAGETLADAQLEAERLKEKACASALEPSAKERARILHRARLEALQLTGGVRKGLVDKALEQAHGRLEEIRTDLVYPRVLKRLLLEALAELNGQEKGGGRGRHALTACLEADPRDRELLEVLLPESGLDLKITYPLTCWGGVIARSEDGRVAVINTLEARLEKSTPYLRRCLAALFEDESPAAKPAQAIEWKIAYEPEKSS
jgi:vacuolar-type H+-ATPase subunit E/Vma4